MSPLAIRRRFFILGVDLRELRAIWCPSRRRRRFVALASRGAGHTVRKSADWWRAIDERTKHPIWVAAFYRHRRSSGLFPGLDALLLLIGRTIALVWIGVGEVSVLSHCWFR